MPHSNQAEVVIEEPEKEVNLPPSLQLDHDTFLRQLAAFHKERGTTFDPAPRVNNKTIDLQKLYRSVLVDGGYDQVSRTQKAWRKLAHEFHLDSKNGAAYAHQLKTAFYKNLA
ncbi:MAG: hypothetical protein Q9207_002854 [Kuettlingeria erythrocarpa]